MRSYEMHYNSRRAAISAVSVYELIQVVRRGRLSLTIEVNEWLHMAIV
ncbi:MAG: hypothetical protein U9N81_02645 [Bacillota bacterium]|nr:hypothetical protein [Bacillota bacterium]